MKNKMTLAIAFVAAAAFSTALQAQSVTFGSAPIGAGDQWSESASYTATITTTVHDSVREVNSTTTAQSVTRSKTSKATAVGGDGRLNGVDVTYSAVSVNGTSLSNVVGKTYRLTVAGSNVTVAYADGNGVPTADEIAFVSTDNAHFGQFRAIDKIVGGKTLAPGAVVTPNKVDAEELVNATEGIAVDSMTMTLSGVSGSGAAQVATFNVSIVLRGGVTKGASHKTTEEFAGAVTMTLSGTMDIKVQNSRPAGLNVAGPTSLAARKNAKAGTTKQMTLSGAGNSSIAISYSF